MRRGVRKPIPRWVLRNLPFMGVCRLGVGRYRYYGIVGLSRAVKDWYLGGFKSRPGERFKADYLLDLKTGVWWHTGRIDALAVRRLEKEYAAGAQWTVQHGVQG